MKMKKNNKKKHITLLIALRASFANMWRNKFLTIATILVMAILIFIFNIILAVNFVAKSALDELTHKVDVVVYLKDDVEYYQVQQMIKELRELKGITNVGYTSKADALEIVAKTHPKTAEFLERYGVDNPLPPSINITTERPELHVMVQQFLNQEKYRKLLANVISEGGQQAAATQAVSRNLINLSQATNQIIFWVFAIFIIGAILIISNAIQLTIYNRQREIFIMRLVGATHNFIRLPFLIEGLFYGLISMLVASILLYLLATQIQIAQVSIPEYLSNIPILKIFFIELGLATAAGILCSYIAVYRYLRTKQLHH